MIQKKKEAITQSLILSSRSSVFMFVGIIGSAVGAIFTYYGKFGLNFGVVVTLFFLIMFISGLIAVSPE